LEENKIPSASQFLPQKTWQKVLAVVLGIALLFILVWLGSGIWEAQKGKTFMEAMASIGEFIFIICAGFLYLIASGVVLLIVEWIMGKAIAIHLVKVGYEKITGLVIMAIVWTIILLALYGILSMFMSLRLSTMVIVLFLLIFLSKPSRKS